jgi:hypothetical protein
MWLNSFGVQLEAGEKRFPVLQSAACEFLRVFLADLGFTNEPQTSRSGIAKS